MIKKVDKNANRQKRHRRVRKKISGTPERPRLNVFKSNKYIYAQVIDDVNGKTLAAASSLQKPVQEQIEQSEEKSPARIVGESVGQKALEAGITTVVFDRGGYLYVGQVKDLAEGARAAGLKF